MQRRLEDPGRGSFCARIIEQPVQHTEAHKHHDAQCNNARAQRRAQIMHDARGSDGCG